MSVTTQPTREDIKITSGKDFLAGWLYRSTAASNFSPGAAKLPVVVLAHGLGAVKEMRLDAYAAAFQRAGYSAVVFDYRYFGGSSGLPRQLLDINSQLADWATALRYARSLDFVDPAKVAVFGTSFGGGHVLSMSARDSKIAAVISQCPFTSGLASSGTVGLIALPFIVIRAVLDQILGLFTRRIVPIKLKGKPGEAALMNRSDVVAGVNGLLPPGHNIAQYVGARIALWLPLYFPGWAARRAKMPVFVAVCGKDTVAPPGPTMRYAKRIPKGEVKYYEDLGHFDIYLGEPFERVTKDYIAFLNKHVPLA
ncbi:hypothetical protein OC846_001852 [Tilletia horrida]|uniref:AB hydrolase-1 domain-containing protein n=1 Tax=Tilletia horrida TaxID=155126 RepID=A0AAN6GSG0_9BASI|nr:hypothetical protein OC845_001618 [Tilletia horrida]KAK0554995.1 hypothetical protein OC846_001852 [Tilletia horrida]KAK0568369.1 hypothetical protein OC861_001998 [Tilletia horrida]